MPDVFDQLADRDVPPPPEGLRRGVHQRLNRWLVALDLLEFVCCAVPYAAGWFAKSVVNWIFLTVTGRHHAGRTPRSGDVDRD